MHWLEKRAALTPERIAIFKGGHEDRHKVGQAITFAQLRARSIATALRLVDLGVSKKAHVAILCNNGPHVPVLIHAIHYLGAVVVPLNTRLTAHELAYQLEDANGDMLIYDESLQALVQATMQQVPSIPIVNSSEIVNTSDSDAVQISEQRTSAIQTSIHTDDYHSIIYTSGTTGRPKGVMLSFANYWASAVDAAINLGLNDDDHWLACLPLFHVGGMSILMRSVIYGIPVTIHESFDPYMVNETIINSRVTIISVVSAMLARMIDAVRERSNHIAEPQKEHTLYPDHLRCILLGGGPAPMPLLQTCQTYDIPVFQTYGLTETASQIATLSPDYALSKLGSAGKPLFQSELKIVANGALAPAHEVGEIYVRGPSVTTGYWRHMTEKKLGMDTIPAIQNDASPDDSNVQSKQISKKNPDLNSVQLQPAQDESGWLATGDLGYLDEEGFLYVLDRRSDLIISGGENVYPAEIESALLSHPDVAEAGVTGIDDERWGQVPIAFVVMKEDATFSEQALIAYCTERLAKYKIPAAIRRTTHLPRTASNKLQRRKLKNWK